MRPLLAVLALAFTTSTVVADTRPISLSADDVTAKLEPYADEIEHCYLDRTAEIYGAGKLAIELTVSKKGAVQTLAIKTPGLSTKLGMQIGTCITQTLTGIAFPARRTHTTATVPFFFQRTAARGAGPLLSCFKAEGCRG